MNQNEHTHRVTESEKKITTNTFDKMFNCLIRKLLRIKKMTANEKQNKAKCKEESHQMLCMSKRDRDNGTFLRKLSINNSPL